MRVVCKGLFFLGTEASDLQDCSTAVNNSKLPGFSQLHNIWPWNNFSSYQKNGFHSEVKVNLQAST